MFAVVAMIGGTADPIIIVFAMVTGGCGKIVVKIGTSCAPVGAVALPVLKTGCDGALIEGGIGAGETTAGGVIAAVAIGGGGKYGVKSGKKLDARGAVALPLLNCGCVIPAIDGGTGAGAIGKPVNGASRRLRACPIGSDASPTSSGLRMSGGLSASAPPIARRPVQRLAWRECGRWAT
jgi:hypothetical protein